MAVSLGSVRSDGLLYFAALQQVSRSCRLQAPGDSVVALVLVIGAGAVDVTELDAGLATAVPTLARWKLAGLPKALPADQVAALLASCDPATEVGQRDRAILTVLSRLGLRVGEVAGLRLEDIDWRNGELVVTGKGQRSERLPLPADVGQAIVAYLTGWRPKTSARHVFVCVYAPHGPMSRNTVTNVVARAARRAGLGVMHAHRLRHSAATAMLTAGASLDEIGQVLRHRHALTTTIYANPSTSARCARSPAAGRQRSTEHERAARRLG